MEEKKLEAVLNILEKKPPLKNIKKSVTKNKEKKKKKKKNLSCC